MSIIQSIRNKGVIVSLLIALSLVVFLIQTANESIFKGSNGGNNTSIASINGTNIDPAVFKAKLDEYEANVKGRNNGKPISEEQRNQIREQAWSDLVNDNLMGTEMEKLGIVLTPKELQDMLTSEYADPQVKQSFTDEQTGMFDPSKIKQYITKINSDKTNEGVASREQWRGFENALVKQRKNSKYIDLIKNGIYIPKFMIEKAAKEKAQTAAISFVKLPYTIIGDSTVKVSDEEITAYMNKSKDMYTLQEATATADYVVFDIIPSVADTAASLGVLNTLKPEFIATTDNDMFAGKNSDESNDNKFYNAKTLTGNGASEILAAGVGAVVGPYLDNGYYKLAKVLEKKSLPDSVSASHILVGINENRNEDAAKILIDSIEAAIKAGANFAQTAVAKSDDQGSAKKGGDLGTFAAGTMVPEFNEACFNGRVGEYKKVKTQFGWHLIKITAQKSFAPNVKVCFVSKTMAAGQETINKANALASQFVTTAKDAKSFEETSKKMGKDKRVTREMTQNMSDIQGLKNARQLTRFAFDNKVGTVSTVLSMDDKCVVALVTGKQEKGSMIAASATRSQVEPAIKKEKMAKMLIEKAKGKTTLDAIATLGGTVQQADTVLLAGNFNPTIGNEPNVIGASFNKALLNKVSPGIKGEQGVYYITVKNINDAPATTNVNYDMERSQIEGQLKSSMDQYIPAILKRKANITDNRSSFF